MARKIISGIISVLMLISIGVFIIPTISQSTSVQPEGSIVIVASPIGTWQDNYNP